VCGFPAIFLEFALVSNFHNNVCYFMYGLLIDDPHAVKGHPEHGRPSIGTFDANYLI